MAVALGFTGCCCWPEPDMGAFMVIALIAMGILFLGGVNGRMFLLISGACWWGLRAGDRLQPGGARASSPTSTLESRLRAGQGLPADAHSLIAFGRGEIFGQGLGGSVEKLHWLPEAHTDFLLAVIGEELGFVGVACVIVAFFWLTRRIFHIGRQAIALDRVFAGLWRRASASGSASRPSSTWA